MPLARLVANVGDGGQRDMEQFFVRPLDGLGQKAELLGGLHQAQKVRALAVGAGQVADVFQGDRPAVIEGDRRQGGGAAIGLVVLSNQRIAP